MKVELDDRELKALAEAIATKLAKGVKTDELIGDILGRFLK